MVKLAANLSTLWAELPYLDRVEAAAEAGFAGVSVPFPYDVPVKDTQRTLMRSGLSMVQITAPPPNYTGGPRGFAARPELKDRFRYDLRRALRYSDAVRAPILQVMAGDASGPEARDCLIENLCHAVATVPETVTLTLEPRAVDRAFLNSLDIAADVIEAVGSPRVGLQVHLSHVAAMGLDITEVLQQYGQIVRHIQTGPLEEQQLSDALSHLHKYTDTEWIAVDFDTGGDTTARLDWLADALQG